MGDEPARPAPLRIVGRRRPSPKPGAAAATRRRQGGTGAATRSARATAGAAATGSPAPRRRRRAPIEVESEILRLGGRRGRVMYAQLLEAAEAFSRDRDREAARLLRPLRDAMPDAASVRELLGLAQYRQGNYAAGAKELDAFVELTGSVEQHPVLMDCYRAQRRWRRVEDLWEELAATSPSGPLVAEGRIVLAGSLADRGRVAEAIALLERRVGPVARPQEHHLRLWYALADLEERAGNLARARELFGRIRAHDREFADVGARVASLG